jgi:hypothetical protein
MIIFLCYCIQEANKKSKILGVRSQKSEIKIQNSAKKRGILFERSQKEKAMVGQS